MVNNVYALEGIEDGEVTRVVDTGGIDWIDAGPTLTFSVVINLGNTTDGGSANSALGSINDDLFTSLYVLGIVENARGSNLADDLSGNSLANLIFGDQASSGLGGDDSILGYGGDDTVYGGRGNDELFGDAGNDGLYGNDGNDSINGGDGSDTVEGGLGADTLVGETLSYASSDARVVVALGQFACTVSGGHANGDAVFLARNAIGSAFDDHLSDSVAVFNGSNVTRMYGLGGGDVISLGGGNDVAYGGAGRDRVAGDAGNDLLYGGADADLVVGGAGADVASGGAGADRFLFRFLTDSSVSLTGRDRIADFSRSQGDKIDLSAIDAKAGVAGNQAFAFIGQAAAFPAAGQVRIVDAGAFLVVMGNVDNDAQAEFAIRVDGPANLFAGDFIL